MFAGIRLSFDYASGTLDAGKVTVVREDVFENWVRREVLLPTGHPDDPMPVFLFIPRNYQPPYQSVIYLPPADSWSPGFRSDSVMIENYQIDFVPRSGRVLIWPVYSGSHERYDNYHSDAGPERVSLALERNRRVRDEVGRVIDYLQQDSEFDGTRVALMALSYGATLAPFVLATEPRISTAIIYSAGIAPPIPIFANPQNDPNVFWTRVRQPTLVMNGKYDPIRPYEFVARPLIDLLATPSDAKKLILYESAHWPLPRYPMMRDSLEWLDQYLGHPEPQILNR
jgi:pimeloyl-ACP methyl ester carboxylesterase